MVSIGLAGNDLGERLQCRFPLFDHVRKIPYQRDRKGRETVKGPRFLLREFPCRLQEKS